jgi:hypothetical protein
MGKEMDIPCFLNRSGSQVELDWGVPVMGR